MTPQEFIDSTKGKYIDVDGAYGGQCWDLMAKFCQMAGIPLSVIYCGKTRYVIDIWTERATTGILNYFDEVHEFRTGDWCIFPTWYAKTPASHVAMYTPAGAFDQTTARGCAGYTNLDFSQALGGFRWKGWNTMEDEFRYGINYRNFEDAELTVYKAPDGYGLYMLSAGENRLQDITQFDDPGLLIVAATNANYFQMRTDQPDPYGTHYGVEQTYNGVDLAPKKDGLVAWYQHKSGQIFAAKSSAYWHTRDEVQFACTPYSVLIHDGKVINMRSTDLGSKEAVKAEQTMIARVNDRWFIVCCRSKVYPAVMLRYAQHINATEAVLMDSGGSTQLMAFSGTSYRKEIYTGRQLPNVLVIAKEKQADSEPIQSDPVQDEPTPAPIEDEPATGGNEGTGMNDNVTKTLLPDRVYDILKWVALIALPAVSVFVLTMGADLTPNYEVIAKFISAVSVLLGSLIGVSTVQYNSARGKQNE